MTASRWIDVDGAVNMRDVGGLPTEDGRVVKPGRLIRSDSLQGLSDDDVRHLVDRLHVRAVADLRSDVEVTAEGPGPITREPDVEIVNLSLFPEVGKNTDAVAVEDGPVVLPWTRRERLNTKDERRRGVSGVYLSYLEDRADSVVDALRLIADTDGATIVHCAAGKDRTGVVVAFALAEVGVAREAIIQDYAMSAERIDAILERLSSSRTYASDMEDAGKRDLHRPRASTMERMLAEIDARYGGVPAWLRAHGWTEADAKALRARLLD